MKMRLVGGTKDFKPMGRLAQGKTIPMIRMSVGALAKGLPDEFHAAAISGGGLRGRLLTPGGVNPRFARKLEAWFGKLKGQALKISLAFRALMWSIPR
ncbi:MAG: hypothetical protein K9N23_03830 [Akkermansiaceae bacterium]|nr:hypothetical protein [Akkermansiaceae bacterium]